jgi:HEAT repeat protein/beta-lactamase regulating signal transducer with metallopeptidase domain
MSLFSLLPHASDATLLSIADATIKATLVLAAAAVASVALSRASAAVRHLVWTLALVSGMVLPVLSMALPRWQLPLVTLQSVVAAPQGTAPNLDAVRAPGLRPERATSSPAPVAAGAVQVAPAAWSSLLPVISPRSALFLIWALGAAVIIGRLAAGLAAVQWMSRRTERVTSAPWLAQARRLAAELDVSPAITFLRSNRASMPMAWGIVHPSVLMPADADNWPAERLRIVLLHELAHVKRRDCLTHVLAQMTCALYWFNPLAWVAARHARTERERACDDLVLAAGTKGPDYAQELIEIARVMRGGRFPAVLAGATLAIAHRSQLEGRLMAILDPSVPRSAVSKLRAAGATTAFACALMPLAALQPWGYLQEPADVRVKADAAVQTGQADFRVKPEASVQAGQADFRLKPGAAARSHASATATAQATARAQSASSAASDRDTVREAVRDAIAGSSSGIVQAAIGGALQAIGPAVEGALQSRDKRKPSDPRTIAALTAALKDTDNEVREAALHALVQLRDPSVFQPLVQALADASADLREQAAFGLGQLGDRRAVEPLIALLKDQNGDVREQVAFALGQIRDKAAIAALTGAVADVDADVREQVVFALGQLGDVAALEGLSAALRDAMPNVREQAAFALGQIHDSKSVQPLISALKDSNADVREQAAFALGQIRDPAAVEALVIALKDSNADVREQAAFALGQLRDPRAIDGLTAALKDPSADVRRQAAFALGQIAR